MRSSAGLMNSFATTRYANFIRGCVMARTIVETTLTKTQTCVVGWNCHSQGFSLKTIDGYFISPCLSVIQEGIFHCHFIQDFKQFLVFFCLFVFLSDRLIHSFFCLFNSSKTLLPSYKAIPLQKWSRLSTCGSSVQQSGWLWWQLGRRWVWWA